jgi:DNA-binding NarL/FixJ family response regulator
MDAPRGLSMPVFVVDPELSVLERNRSASDLLRERRGLTLVAGQLRVGRREEHESLVRTVGRVVGQASLTHTYEVDITSAPPLQLRVRALAGGRSVARASRIAVYVLEQCHHAPLHRILGSVYGFTPTEAGIIRELLQGRDVQAIADSLALNVYAVRRQLEALCAKTATTGEAELAARIVASLAVIR